MQGPGEAPVLVFAVHKSQFPSPEAEHVTHVKSHCMHSRTSPTTLSKYPASQVHAPCKVGNNDEFVEEQLPLHPFTPMAVQVKQD